MFDPVANAIKSTTTDIRNVMSVIDLGIEMGWITDTPAIQVALAQIMDTIEKEVFPVIDTQRKIC